MVFVLVASMLCGLSLGARAQITEWVQPLEKDSKATAHGVYTIRKDTELSIFTLASIKGKGKSLPVFGVDHQCGQHTELIFAKLNALTGEPVWVLEQVGGDANLAAGVSTSIGVGKIFLIFKVSVEDGKVPAYKLGTKEFAPLPTTDLPKGLKECLQLMVLDVKDGAISHRAWLPTDPEKFGGKVSVGDGIVYEYGSTLAVPVKTCSPLLLKKQGAAPSEPRLAIAPKALADLAPTDTKFAGVSFALGLSFEGEYIEHIESTGGLAEVDDIKIYGEFSSFYMVGTIAKPKDATKTTRAFGDKTFKITDRPSVYVADFNVIKMTPGDRPCAWIQQTPEVNFVKVEDYALRGGLIAARFSGKWELEGGTVENSDAQHMGVVLGFDPGSSTPQWKAQPLPSASRPLKIEATDDEYYVVAQGYVEAKKQLYTRLYTVDRMTANPPREVTLCAGMGTCADMYQGALFLTSYARAVGTHTDLGAIGYNEKVPLDKGFATYYMGIRSGTARVNIAPTPDKFSLVDAGGEFNLTSDESSYRDKKVPIGTKYTVQVEMRGKLIETVKLDEDNVKNAITAPPYEFVVRGQNIHVGVEMVAATTTVDFTQLQASEGVVKLRDAYGDVPAGSVISPGAEVFVEVELQSGYGVTGVTLPAGYKEVAPGRTWSFIMPDKNVGKDEIQFAVTNGLTTITVTPVANGTLSVDYGEGEKKISATSNSHFYLKENTKMNFAYTTVRGYEFKGMSVTTTKGTEPLAMPYTYTTTADDATIAAEVAQSALTVNWTPMSIREGELKITDEYGELVQGDHVVAGTRLTITVTLKAKMELKEQVLPNGAKLTKSGEDYTAQITVNKTIATDEIRITAEREKTPPPSKKVNIQAVVEGKGLLKLSYMEKGKKEVKELSNGQGAEVKAGTEVTFEAVERGDKLTSFVVDRERVKGNRITKTVDSDMKVILQFTAAEPAPHTAVSASAEATLAISPNPAGRAIRVEGLSEDGEARIYTASGQLIRTVVVHADGVVGLQGLSSGVYFLRIGAKTARFVKL